MIPESLKENKIVLNIGRKGSGKSYLVKEMLTRRSPRRVIIFDPMCEYNLNGYTYADDVNSAKQHIAERLDADMKLVCRFDNEEDYVSIIGMMDIIEDCWLVIEEFHIFCNYTHTYPEMKRLLRFGRHWRVSLLGVTQRCVDVPRDFTAMMDILIVFNTTEPRDIDYLRRIAFIGDAGVEKVVNLSKYEPAIFLNE